MSADHEAQLLTLGFIWNRHDAVWEEYFAQLRSFHQSNGHSQVPKEYAIASLKLGLWVSSQRSKRSSLSPERIARLTALGFTWNPRDDQWAHNLSALRSFVEREGHSRVPYSHREGDVNLGWWVANIRKSYREQEIKGGGRGVITLSQERVSQLNELGMIWD
jgi:hypothetical protein